MVELSSTIYGYITVGSAKSLNAAIEATTIKVTPNQNAQSSSEIKPIRRRINPKIINIPIAIVKNF